MYKAVKCNIKHILKLFLYLKSYSHFPRSSYIQAHLLHVVRVMYVCMCVRSYHMNRDSKDKLSQPLLLAVSTIQFQKLSSLSPSFYKNTVISNLTRIHKKSAMKVGHHQQWALKTNHWGAIPTYFHILTASHKKYWCLCKKANKKTCADD